MPVGVAINDGDFMAAFEQMPSGADADDSRAQNDDFHAGEFRGNALLVKVKLKRLRKQ